MAGWQWCCQVRAESWMPLRGSSAHFRRRRHRRLVSPNPMLRYAAWSLCGPHLNTDGAREPRLVMVSPILEKDHLGARGDAPRPFTRVGSFSSANFSPSRGWTSKSWRLIPFLPLGPHNVWNGGLAIVTTRVRDEQVRVWRLVGHHFNPYPCPPHCICYVRNEYKSVGRTPRETFASTPSHTSTHASTSIYLPRAP